MLEKYYRFSSVAGVNIDIGKDGLIVFNACLLKINGNLLEIGRKIVGATNINDLKKEIPSGTLVALNLTGRKIQITKSTLIVDKPDFATLMPAANPEDFYTQVFNSGNNSFVSLTRKDEADKWINQIQNIGMVPITLSLGAFVIDQIIPQLNSYDREMKFAGHWIEQNEQKEWTSYKYLAETETNYPFKIENEKIDERLLIPYAAAFQLALYPVIDLIQADVDALTAELSKRADRVKIKVKSTMILVLFFFLLLFNFLLFSYYNSINLKLATQVGLSVQMANSAQSFADTLKSNQQLLENMGWEGKADKSVLIDQIAQLLPREVNWQQVVIDPLGTNPDHNISQQIFAERKIIVRGISERLIPVNEWIARLKTIHWVKNAQLQSYYFNNEINTGQFVIEINY